MLTTNFKTVSYSRKKSNPQPIHHEQIIFTEDFEKPFQYINIQYFKYNCNANK